MRVPARGESAFTLIELLVVILIIAILAAIAIPIFYRQRERGYEAQIQGALKNAAGAVASYGTENGGDFSGLNTATNPDYAAKLQDQGFTIPAYLTYLNVVSTGTTYCIEARHSLLTATSAWRRSTYREVNGGPLPTPDTCP
jgi:prepilin-type N-terminal cleavage/methylation domain-containing protein